MPTPEMSMFDLFALLIFAAVFFVPCVLAEEANEGTPP